MTPAVEAAKRAGIEFTLHEYEGVEVGDGDYARAVAAALGRPAGQLFKTLVVSVDGDLRAFVVPADRQLDLRSVGKRAQARRPRAGRARDRLRRRRHQPARPAAAAADGGRRVGARLGDDPGQRRPARPADRARAAGPVALTAATVARAS